MARTPPFTTRTIVAAVACVAALLLALPAAAQDKGGNTQPGTGQTQGSGSGAQPGTGSSGGTGSAQGTGSCCGGGNGQSGATSDDDKPVDWCCWKGPRPEDEATRTEREAAAQQALGTALDDLKSALGNLCFSFDSLSSIAKALQEVSDAIDQLATQQKDVVDLYNKWVTAQARADNHLNKTGHSDKALEDAAAAASDAYQQALDKAKQSLKNSLAPRRVVPICPVGPEGGDIPASHHHGLLDDLGGSISVGVGVGGGGGDHHHGSSSDSSGGKN